MKESVLMQKWKMAPEEQVQILEARKQYHDKEQALHNIIQIKDKLVCNVSPHGKTFS